MRLVLYLTTDLTFALQKRLEFSGPSSSFPRLLEGFFLSELSTSDGHVLTGYEGYVSHHSPLIYLIYQPLRVLQQLISFSIKHQYLPYLILSICVDVAIAYALRSLVCFYHTYPVPVPHSVLGFNVASSVKTVDVPPRPRLPLSLVTPDTRLPDLVAAAWLLNPFSVLSCLSLSPSLLPSCCLLWSIVFTLHSPHPNNKSPSILAAVTLALAVVLDVSFVWLVPPVVYLRVFVTQDRHIQSLQQLRSVVQKLTQSHPPRTLRLEPSCSDPVSVWKVLVSQVCLVVLACLVWLLSGAAWSNMSFLVNVYSLQLGMCCVLIYWPVNSFFLT